MKMKALGGKANVVVLKMTERRGCAPLRNIRMLIELLTETFWGQKR